MVAGIQQQGVQICLGAAPYSLTVLTTALRASLLFSLQVRRTFRNCQSSGIASSAPAGVQGLCLQNHGWSGQGGLSDEARCPCSGSCEVTHEAGRCLLPGVWTPKGRAQEENCQRLYCLQRVVSAQFEDHKAWCGYAVLGEHLPASRRAAKSLIPRPACCGCTLRQGPFHIRVLYRQCMLIQHSAHDCAVCNRSKPSTRPHR